MRHWQWQSDGTCRDVRNLKLDIDPDACEGSFKDWAVAESARMKNKPTDNTNLYVFSALALVGVLLLNK